MIECADRLPPGKVLPVMALTPGLLSAGRAWQGEACLASPSPSSPSQLLLHKFPPLASPAGAPASIPGASAPSGVHAGELPSGEKRCLVPFSASVTAYSSVLRVFAGHCARFWGHQTGSLLLCNINSIEGQRWTLNMETNR